eukprot:scaffold7979_cov417-Prasinococcus_capsulatus_cf.AAC.4
MVRPCKRCLIAKAVSKDVVRPSMLAVSAGVATYVRIRLRTGVTGIPDAGTATKQRYPYGWAVEGS